MMFPYDNSAFSIMIRPQNYLVKGLVKDNDLGSNKYVTYGFTQDMTTGLLGQSPVFACFVKHQKQM